MSAFPDPQDIDLFQFLSELPIGLPLRKISEEFTVLKPALADLYRTDRAQFAVVAKLVKEKLGIGRRDLEASLKPLQENANEAEHTTLSARFPNLVDLVEDRGDVRFLMRDEQGGLCTSTEWDTGSQILIPPSHDNLPWPLLQAAEVIAAYNQQENSSALYTDLSAYYRSLVDLPSKTHYSLLTAFTFHTYTLDFPEVTHSSEVVFYAVPERGKSRGGKAITHVAMRGLRTETLREANIFRWSEDLGATIFFDVMNLWKKAEREKKEPKLLGS